MTQGQSREDKIKQDVADLHGLGYAQELFRSMGGFSNFAISFSIISILTGAVILYDYGPRPWAGTAAVMIGWPLITVFVLAIAASMQSSHPHTDSGGLYYWLSKMKNKNWAGGPPWLNLIGQFRDRRRNRLTAAAGFLNATILDRLTGACFNTTEIIPGILNGQLVTMGVILGIQLATHIAGINLVALLNQVSVWWHIVIVAIVVVFIFATGKPDQSGLSLFQIQPLTRPELEQQPGLCQSPIRARLELPHHPGLLLLTVAGQLDVYRYDASAHVAEETVAPGQRAPGGSSCRSGECRRGIHLPGRPDHPFAEPVHALSGDAGTATQRDLEPVLLRRRRRRHCDPAVQPWTARRHLAAASRSRCGSVASRPWPRRVECSLPSVAMTGSPDPAGSSA